MDPTPHTALHDQPWMCAHTYNYIHDLSEPKEATKLFTNLQFTHVYYACMYTHTHTHTHMHAHTRARTHTHTHTHTYVRTHTHTHTYTHTSTVE